MYGVSKMTVHEINQLGMLIKDKCKSIAAGQFKSNKSPRFSLFTVDEKIIERGSLQRS